MFIQQPFTIENIMYDNDIDSDITLVHLSKRLTMIMLINKQNETPHTNNYQKIYIISDMNFIQFHIINNCIKKLLITNE